MPGILHVVVTCHLLAVRGPCAVQVHAYGFTFHDDQGENIVRTMLPLIDLANHAEAGAFLTVMDARPYLLSQHLMHLNLCPVVVSFEYQAVQHTVSYFIMHM